MLRVGNSYGRTKEVVTIKNTDVWGIFFTLENQLASLRMSCKRNEHFNFFCHKSRRYSVRNCTFKKGYLTLRTPMYVRLFLKTSVHVGHCTAYLDLGLSKGESVTSFLTLSLGHIRKRSPKPKRFHFSPKSTFKWWRCTTFSTSS